MTTSNTTTSPSWSGQCALITGGADGLGFAVARRLAARGVRLMLLDMNRAALDRAAALLGPGTLALQIGVTDGNGGRDVVEFAPSRVRYVRVNCKEQGERATTGNGKGDGQTDAQLTRPGTTAGGIEEWRKIAAHENSLATEILERPYGYRKLREGYDIWDLQVFEK